MIFLAKNNGKVFSLKEVSKREGIPFDYLEKIISRLKRANLVLAKKGIKGGYFLARPSSKIKIGQIIKALEKRKHQIKCLFSYCPRENICSAKIFWKKLERAINFTLNSTKLSQLIKK